MSDQGDLNQEGQYLLEDTATLMGIVYMGRTLRGHNGVTPITR